MENIPDYININKETWNKKTAVHVASDFYNNEAFLNGKSSLNSFEIDLLGDVSHKKILHLQCHFGQDTLSLARLGAKVTGIDFSDQAIEKAKEYSKQLDLDASFICCDVYDTPNHLDEKFDIVFTSYGTIGWLPDMDKWAAIVSHFLKPSGTFVFVEFHPFIWMFDNDFKEVFYNYFKSEPIIEEEMGTYADKKASLIQKTVSWNHSLSEVVNALIQNGLSIHSLNEYDYSPYNCLNGMEEFETGKFRIKIFENKVPLIYSIKASKK
ncbi:bifunctional 2-polyprenyl-6-hydroxyphenol methylase/3-demethylubiquinol 3-O-methyltransferase UbiG [Flavobacterium sp.]|uniref:class I SAM-dependent methyltransferase n=1 Tax=Flavobacterium sp. TaxID=239 RepID=UPI0025C71AAE|nr:class I SAM-dependent methyltransferase [Flavobacterium sp.]MBA4154395.1 SAM-dependent methyltransferase [Flavobacterium sp.]